MKYPKLVPSWVCTTPITLELEYEGINEDGSPNSVVIPDLLCNWEDGGKAIYTADQKVINISGTAYFDGDISKCFETVSGGNVVLNDLFAEDYGDGNIGILADNLSTFMERSGHVTISIPSLTNIVSGFGEIFGERREIAQGFKRRNPDGTVNYTEIRFK